MEVTVTRREVDLNRAKRLRRLLASRAVWILVLIAACGDEKSSALTTRERVWLKCSQLSNDLNRAAQSYEELAPLLPTFNEQQRERADLALPYGLSWRLRAAHTQHIYESMLFCTYSKRGYEPWLDVLSTMEAVTVDEFATGDGPLAPDVNYQSMARSMRKLATIAYILRSMPIGD
jgi:hypothetical protein